MPLEIIETHDNSPKGKFLNRANQETHRSAWAVVEGPVKQGWDDSRSLQEGVPTSDHRRRVRFAPFKDEAGKYNDIHFDGMKLREHVATVEDCKEKEQYEANLSSEKCETYLHPSPVTEAGLGVRSQVEIKSVPALFQI